MGSVGVAKLVAWGFVVAMLLVVACTSAEEGPAETGAVPAAAPPLQPPVAETATVAPTQAPPTPTALPPTPSPVAQAPAPEVFSRLANEEVGYSLVYPSEWTVRGQVVWRQFANDPNAQCRSVEVTDAQLPPGSGIPFEPHSNVQVCAKPLTDTLSLDEFMHQIYNDGRLADFEIVDLNGTTVYRTTSEVLTSIVFLQTKDYRLEILTTVATLPDKMAERFSQVQAIIDSFQVIETSP